MPPLMICKFNLDTQSTCLEVPGCVALLDVAGQHDTLRVWALVDQEMLDEIHYIKVRILGTGNLVSYSNLQELKYWKTWHTKNGYVWHVFIDKRYPIGYEGGE